MDVPMLQPRAPETHALTERRATEFVYRLTRAFGKRRPCYLPGDIIGYASARESAGANCESLRWAYQIREQKNK